MTRNRETARLTGANHLYVERRAGVCGGEPVIVGTRFPVRAVVTNIYRLGMTPEEMVEAWPYLTLAHIHDALSFYHDHRSLIDRAIRENRKIANRRTIGAVGATRRGTGRLARRRR